jgi:heptosyltransferase I
MKRLSDRPRFLICRLSAIGDTVHTLPVANLIKQRWPDAFVAWAVEQAAAPLVQGQRSVDETIVVPKGFLKSPIAIGRLWRRLRGLRFDVALDPQSLTKSAAIAWLSGARVRIGFRPPIGREFAPWLNSELVAPIHLHVVRRYLEVLRPLGVHASDDEVQFDLPIDPSGRASTERWLAAVGCTGDFAVLNPGASWDSKVWPAERYVEVASRLPLRSVVVWGGERERQWAEKIAAATQGRATLAPATSLLELAALVERGTLFVGSDTGPLHIAAAVGTPCVSIFGPTRAEVSGPFGKGHRVLQEAYEPLGSARKEAGRVSQAMLQVSAEQVVEACEGILSAGDRAKAA